ncbi:hypothetical protein BT69DRAFT_1354892 [Atractiella rhizophila]|nr:hypothetical protein BT69DRAFT_1354892 [Atractiella rhizophila]
MEAQRSEIQHFLTLLRFTLRPSRLILSLGLYIAYFTLLLTFQERVLFVVSGERTAVDVEVVKQYRQRGAEVIGVVRKGDGYPIIDGVQVVTCKLSLGASLREMASSLPYSISPPNPTAFAHSHLSSLSSPASIVTLPLPPPQAATNTRPSSLPAICALLLPFLLRSSSPALYLLTRPEAALPLPGCTHTSSLAAEVHFLDCLRLETKGLRIVQHPIKKEASEGSVFETVELAVVPEHRELELRVGCVLLSPSSPSASTSQLSVEEGGAKLARLAKVNAELVLHAIDFGEREMWVDGKWFWLTVIRRMGGPAAGEWVGRTGFA